MQTKNLITADSGKNAELEGRVELARPSTGGLAALVLAALFCCAGVAKAAVTLVADGRANAVIVVPSQASRAAAEGAAILRDHLLQISGARLRVLKESELGQIKAAEDRVEPVSGKAVVVLPPKIGPCLMRGFRKIL